MIARILHKRAVVYAAVKHRRVAKYNTQTRSLEHLINENCNPMVFKKTFKIHYETFDLLVQYLNEKPSRQGIEHSALYHWVESRRDDSMTLRTAVACGVLYLFGSGSLDEKAPTLGMHKSTFDVAANRVIAELVERSNDVIYFPPKDEQVFLESRNVRRPFPGGLFAIDGTLCRCATKGRRNDFYCRKGYACINVQLVCDWNRNLVHIDPNYTGRTQDNDMFMASPLQRLLDGPNSPLRAGGFILADEGYANCGSIMRPFTDRDRDPGHQLFNHFFKSARLIVENAIGGWKKKCPLLNVGLHKMDPEDLVCVVHASAVLYQFCKRAEEQLFRTVRTSYLRQRFPIPDFLVTAPDTIQKRTRLVEYFNQQYPRAYHSMALLVENQES